MHGRPSPKQQATGLRRADERPVPARQGSAWRTTRHGAHGHGHETPSSPENASEAAAEEAAARLARQEMAAGHRVVSQSLEPSGITARRSHNGTAVQLTPAVHVQQL